VAIYDGAITALLEVYIKNTEAVLSGGWLHGLSEITHQQVGRFFKGGSLLDFDIKSASFYLFCWVSFFFSSCSLLMKMRFLLYLFASAIASTCYAQTENGDDQKK